MNYDSGTPSRRFGDVHTDLLTLLEGALLVFIAWPVVRAGSHPALRRAFPRTAAALALGMATSAAAIAGLALWSPQLLHPITAAATGGALLAWVAARPAAGRSRGLPPGPLTILPFANVTDPDHFRKCFDRYGDVFKVNQFGIGAGPNPLRGFLQPVCCVDLRQGIAILRDHDQRLHPPAIPSSRFIPKKYLREMRPADHRRYRRLFGAAFVSEVVDESAGFMARHVRSSLLQLAQASSRSEGRGVSPEVALVEMTFGLFSRCFVGLVPGEPGFGRLRNLIGAIDLANRDDRAVERALDELAAVFRGQAQRYAFADRPPRSFLGELARRAPDPLDDLTAMRNFIYILQASWIDLAGLVVWIFKELAGHPEWVARLRGEGGADAAAGRATLSSRCVRETLRLRQSEYLYRKVLEDIPIGEFRVPKGWLLRVCVRESHRDPRVFADPDTFNPDRFLDSQPAREAWSPFGASRIACLGEHLTLTVGRIMVEELAATIDVANVRDGPLEYRRWHWKPSSAWRVHVARATQSDTRAGIRVGTQA